MKEEKIRKSLQEIDYEYLTTLRELEEYFEENPDEGGIVPEEFLERLNINKNELEHKLYNYYKFIKRVEAIQENLKEERKRLMNRTRTKGNLIDRLKFMMGEAVRRYGTPNKTGNEKIETDYLNATYIHKNKLELSEFEEVPDKYKNMVLTIEVGYSTNVHLEMAKLMDFISLNPGHVKMNELTFKVDMSRINEKFKDTPTEDLPPYLKRVGGGYLRFS